MITSKSGKAFGANPISMGGLRFAEPVKVKAKRTKKVVVEQSAASVDTVAAQPEAPAQTEATLDRDIAA